MRVRSFGLKSLLVAIAASAIAIRWGGVVAESQRMSRRATEFEAQSVRCWQLFHFYEGHWDATTGPCLPYRCPWIRRFPKNVDRGLANHYDLMMEKYLWAARHPALSVPPDPPVPRRSPQPKLDARPGPVYRCGNYPPVGGN